MSKINQATMKEFDALKELYNYKVLQANSFEEAAQIYTNVLYEQFRESLVLARVFATIPYVALPPTNKDFVDKLAVAKQVSQFMQPDTLVLSLFGTRGVEPAWNDRFQSKGHIGIPLVSASFIDAIPMMSRLLKQLGVGLDWIDSSDKQIISKVMGSISGVFFVEDAANEVDQQGRKIIPAQEFVAEYGVKTVFGFGGGFLGSETFMLMILFLREQIEKSKAELFASVCSLKASTVNLVRQHNLFQ